MSPQIYVVTFRIGPTSQLETTNIKQFNLTSPQTAPTVQHPLTYMCIEVEVKEVKHQRTSFIPTLHCILTHFHRFQ